MVESGSVEWCEGWCVWWRVGWLSGVKVGVCVVESGSVEWCEGWCVWWRVGRLSGVKVGVCVESDSLGKERTPITSGDRKWSIDTLSNCFKCPHSHVEQLFPIAIVHLVFVHACSAHWLHVSWCGRP